MASSRPPDASKPTDFHPVRRSLRRTRRATREACAFTRDRKRERTSTCERADSIAASDPRTTVQSACGAPGATAAAGEGAGGTTSSSISDDEVLGEERLGVRGNLVREGREKRLDVSPRIHERRFPRREVILEVRGKRFDQAACRGGVDRHTSPDGAIARAFGVVFAALYSDSTTRPGPEATR